VDARVSLCVSCFSFINDFEGRSGGALGFPFSVVARVDFAVHTCGVTSLPALVSMPERIMQCPSCKSELKPGWKACPECGEKLPQEWNCPSCGELVQANWKCCPNCETDLAGRPLAAGAATAGAGGVSNSGGVMRATGDIVGGNKQEGDFRQVGGAAIGGNIVLNLADMASRDAGDMPTLVLCPICGLRNPVENTFRCVSCGRDHLCRGHLVRRERCCDNCTSKAAQRRTDGELASEDAQRQTSERAAQERWQAEARRRKLDVILVECPASHTIRVIAALRKVKMGFGLADASALLKRVPTPVLEGVTKAEAEAAKDTLKEAGAKIEVRQSGGA
jgi:ribosomal protein L7/L12